VLPQLIALQPAAQSPSEQLAVPPLFWAGFALFILAMLALDLGVFGRRRGEVSFKSACIGSAVWIALALLFGVGLYFWQSGAAGHAAALDLSFRYLTGYLVELSLSIDNLFVIALIFAYFRVEPRHQHAVLFWGILGALVMRAVLIFLGVDLIHRFHWMIYVFGAFLILTGVKMVVSHGKQMDPDKNPVIRLFKKLMPVTDSYHEHHFFVRLDGRRHATPLFIALLMVEVTDLVFAVDSIPAILSISSVPFIVVTSNAFAVMGLRSLYFALAGFIDKFHLLHYGLSAVLVFVGTKMLLAGTAWKIPIGLSLLIVLLLIGAAVLASVLIKPKHDRHPHGSHADGTAGDILPEDIVGI